MICTRTLVALAALATIVNAAGQFEKWKHLPSQNGIGPEDQSAGALVSDGRNLYAFGGHKENFISAFVREITFSNDLWKFDLRRRKWSKLEAANAPSPRAFVRGVYSHRLKKAFFYGGITFNNDFGDGMGFSGFDVYDPRANTWEHIGVPPAGREGPGSAGVRGGYEIILREKRGSVKIYIACGVSPNPFGFGFHNDVWEYDVLADSWTELPSLPGFPRQAITGGWLQTGDKLIIYGGEGHDGTNFVFAREVWTLDLGVEGADWVLRDDGLGAIAPDGEDATTGAAWGSNMYIFGGDASEGSVNCGAPFFAFRQDIVDSTHVWDDRSSQWAELSFSSKPPPLKRAFFTVSEPYLYVTGGFDFQDPDTWPEDEHCGQVWNNEVYRLRIAPVTPWWNFWGWWVGFGGGLVVLGGGGAVYARRRKGKKTTKPAAATKAEETTADVVETA